MNGTLELRLTERLRQADVWFDVCDGMIEQHECDDLGNSIRKQQQTVTASKVLKLVPEVLEIGLDPESPEDSLIEQCLGLWIERQRPVLNRLIQLERDGVIGSVLASLRSDRRSTCQ